MNQISNEGGPDGPEAKRPQGRGGMDRLLKTAIAAVAIIGVLAAVYVIAHASFKPGAAPDIKSLARGDMVKLQQTTDPKPAPTTTFSGPDGRPMHLSDFEGQVVVLNFWATWCAPCVTEMPSLAKLQAAYANRPVKVVAITVDRAADEADARVFLAKHGPLVFYADPKFAMPFALQPRVVGLPTTVIYDRDGKERARLSGGADWSGSDARAVIDQVLAGN
jgi:thiol-disulfide isomerase/thioredoxin